jgi:6,7-dimethyl-8-ribityllumazine synthase
VAVVVSRYNSSITDVLLEGAQREYAARGGSALEVFHAPGAYELPMLAARAATAGRFGGVVALGCLIRGDTRHDRYIADAVAHGLMTVALQSRVPVAFGVLTVENAKQAQDRAGGKKGNKGEEAMAAVLDTIRACEAIDMPREAPSVRGAAEANGDVIKPDKARSRAAKLAGGR